MRSVAVHLREHRTDHRVSSADTVIQYKQKLKDVVEAIHDNCFTYSDVKSLERAMRTRASRAASSVKLVESLNSIPGTTVRGRPGAWVSREHVCIIVDCCNSAVRDKNSRNKAAIMKVLHDYEEFFDRAVSVYQKVVYVQSPNAEFWKISDNGHFNRVIQNVASAARDRQIPVLDGVHFWSGLHKYRLSDNWHFQANLQMDWDFLLPWERFLQQMHEAEHGIDDRMKARYREWHSSTRVSAGRRNGD